jgi:hypothetical protein
VFNAAANIEIWPCENSNPNQQFFTEDNGFVVWAPTYNTGHAMCLCVAGGLVANGTNIFLWPCNTKDNNQLFKWDAQGLLRWVAHPSMCVDVAGGVKKAGTNVQLWGCAAMHRADLVASSNQQFAFISSVAGKCKEV